ncbi:AraC family transcriptional regulator [uncultured Sphingomonas sp.]|uniref:AraC family transcriptional regulator n=1 Tax=uncultured Sphingomonas sp. TaxID=158754 RepID=UPI0030F6F6E3
MLIDRWSTLAIPRPARFDVMREMLMKGAIPIRLERDGLDRDGGFIAHVEVHGFAGGVGMVRNLGQAASGVRGAAEIARGAPDCLWAIRYRRTSGRIALNGREIEVRPGDIVYGDGGVEVLASGGPFVDFDQWVFPAGLLRDLLARPEGDPVGIIRHTTPLGRLASDYLAHLPDALEMVSPDDACSLMRHMAMLIALNRGLSADAGEVAQASLADLRLREIVRYIDKHCADPQLTPRLIARAQGLSERALQRLFEGTGKSCARVLLEARLNAAQALLQRRPAGTIADVAFACGFDSLSSFYRNFRAHFGHAPGDVL